ncbi:MAG: CinA family protein [Rhodospirillales bacterium]
MFTADRLARAEAVLDACRKAGLRLTTAESCTGGLIAACLTAIPGSSEVVERGYVVYTNEAKEELLGVPERLFIDFGAVSEEVAKAMAEGAIRRSPAGIAVAVTGIAGPGGATETKPVGLVHVAAAREGRDTLHQRHVFEGDREAVRMRAVDAALEMVRRLAG